MINLVMDLFGLDTWGPRKNTNCIDRSMAVDGSMAMNSTHAVIYPYEVRYFEEGEDQSSGQETELKLEVVR